MKIGVVGKGLGLQTLHVHEGAGEGHRSQREKEEKTMIDDHSTATAVTLHFLATGIFELDKDKELPLYDGLGQDGFVYELYDYAKTLSEVWARKCQDKDYDNYPGVFDYEVSEDLAARLFVRLNKADELEKWSEEVEKLITLWCKGGYSSSRMYINMTD